MEEKKYNYLPERSLAFGPQKRSRGQTLRTFPPTSGYLVRTLSASLWTNGLFLSSRMDVAPSQAFPGINWRMELVRAAAHGEISPRSSSFSFCEEKAPLRFPVGRHRLYESVELQRRRLASVQDRLDDIGREQRQAK